MDSTGDLNESHQVIQEAIEYINQLENSSSSIGVSTSDFQFSTSFSQTKTNKTRNCLKRKLSEPNICDLFEHESKSNVSLVINNATQEMLNDTTELDFSFIVDYELKEDSQIQSSTQVLNNKENKEDRSSKRTRKAHSYQEVETKRKSYNLRVRSKDQMNSMQELIQNDPSVKSLQKRKRSKRKIN